MKKKQFLRDAFMQHILGTSEENCEKIIFDGIEDILETVNREIVDKHTKADFPAIIAALEKLAQGLRMTVGDAGNELADNLKNMIGIGAINKAEFLRQCKEMGEETE